MSAKNVEHYTVKFYKEFCKIKKKLKIILEIWAIYYNLMSEDEIFINITMRSLGI
jgi:hypothetical protein